jgi:hypothetical protein
MLLAALLAACDTGPVAQGPAEVVREFVERMQGLHGDPDHARAAYELIWSKGRQNLGERAKRASAASGRQVAPEEMLAPSRFSLSFQPKSFAVARTDGHWAEVTVVGDLPSRETTTVSCVLEEGAWRVVLELPPLAPIQKRFEETELSPTK